MTEDSPDNIHSSEHLEAMLSVMEEAAVITDETGHVLYTNQAFELLTGYPSKEVLGKRPDFLANLAIEIDAFKASILEAEPGDSVEFNLTIETKQGGPLEASVTITPHRTQNSDLLYLCVGRDMSRERILQKQLHAMQRMESLGSLSRGIAHRFSNVLVSMSGQAELMIARGGLDSFQEERVQRMLEAAENGRELISQINAFCRTQETPQNPVELGPILRNIIRFVRQVAPPRVEISERLTDQKCLLLATTEEMHQLFLNLITNAFDAMAEEGGSLEVSLKIVEQTLREPPAGVEPKPTLCARVRVADSGHGITPEIEPFIFEPFFTTRKSAQKSGMGLTVVNATVNRHNGIIKIRSAPDHGTSVDVFLPIHEPDIPMKDSLLGPRGNGERILLVDDETFITQSGGNLLLEQGYTVDTSNTVDDAIESLINSGHRYDLVIVDVDMQPKSGLDMIRELRERGLIMRILLTAPLSKMPQPWELQQLGISRVLPKPSPAKDFTQTIREMLTGA